MLHYNLDCVHTPLVPLDNRSNFAAIVGGVIGGLVALVANHEFIFLHYISGCEVK